MGQECSHEEPELRRKPDSLGRDIIFEQCMACGATTTQALPHAATLRRRGILSIKSVPLWDHELASRFCRLRSEHYDQVRRDWVAGRVSERYRAYIRSDLWKETRQRLRLELMDAGEMPDECYVCGDRGSRLDCHHLHYDSLGSEELWDVKFVCRRDHDWIHLIVKVGGRSIAFVTEALAKKHGRGQQW